MKTDGGGTRKSCSFPCPVHGLPGYGSLGNRAEANESEHPQYLDTWSGQDLVFMFHPGGETQPSLAALSRVVPEVLLGLCYSGI